jgi:hypothetical protein
MTPYWLQPMLWTPLTMHMLRYDQMSTQWAQGLAKLNSVMDDNMIYNAASLIPAASRVFTSGATFNLNPADITTAHDAFYYNPNFNGNLGKPQLNDITILEQIYNRQNFDLESEKAVLTLDSTMNAYIDKDPLTQSRLTRWVEDDIKETSFVKYKHTEVHERSRLAIYDPATGTIIDPAGIIPSTAVSAALGFIPSQMAIGLGMLDVFMIQDPTNYGYKMSCDLRINMKPIRHNYYGATLYTYGQGTV